MASLIAENFGFVNLKRQRKKCPQESHLVVVTNIEEEAALKAGAQDMTQIMSDINTNLTILIKQGKVTQFEQNAKLDAFKVLLEQSLKEMKIIDLPS